MAPSILATRVIIGRRAVAALRTRARESSRERAVFARVGWRFSARRCELQLWVLRGRQRFKLSAKRARKCGQCLILAAVES